MHLTDAMIDVTTGKPIVDGEIVLALGKRPPIETPGHRHILLDFGPDRTTLTCRPVTEVRRLGSGFHAVTATEPQLGIPAFGQDAFNGRMEESRVTISGRNCGALYREGHSLFQIAGVGLVQQLQADGLAFRITGVFSATEGADAISLPSCDAGFEINGVIPWPTLQLYDFGGFRRRSDFVPDPAQPVWERIESHDLADPLALADLLLCTDGPLIPGKLTLSGAPPRTKQETSGILILHHESGLSLASCGHVERGADGFCRSMDRREMRFRSPPITLPWIEQLLRKENRATIGLSGDGIGEVAYETGQLVEMGLREFMCIDAERLDFEAALSRAGLHLKVGVALSRIRRRSVGMDDFVPEPNHYHTHFSAVATLPWSHLLVMRSRLVEKRKAVWLSDRGVSR